VAGVAASDSPQATDATRQAADVGRSPRTEAKMVGGHVLEGDAAAAVSERGERRAGFLAVTVMRIAVGRRGRGVCRSRLRRGQRRRVRSVGCVRPGAHAQCCASVEAHMRAAVGRGGTSERDASGRVRVMCR